MLVQLLKIRIEGYGVGSALPKEFATGFFSKLCEEVLAPVDLPVAVPEMPGTAEIDGMHNHAGTLRHCDRAIEIWI